MNVLDGFRPCKQAVKVMEENLEATRDLNKSIAQLTEVLVGGSGPEKRAGDPEGDTSWHKRRSHHESFDP